jgi:hypothetical protein
MIGVRLITGSNLTIQSREGLHVVSLGGITLSGFWAAFLIVVFGWSSLLTIGLYIFVTIAYLVCYTQLILPRFDPPAEE